MVKENKKIIVEELVDRYKKTQAVYFFDYKGLDVEQISSLRELFKANNSTMKVYKNTLSLIALKKIESDLSQNLRHILKGSTASVFVTEDPVLPAKILTEFIKNNDFVTLKGGILEGRFLEKKDVFSIAKLPSKEVLLAKFLMLLNSPISGFVNVFQGTNRSFVQVLNSIKNQKSNI